MVSREQLHLIQMFNVFRNICRKRFGTYSRLHTSACSRLSWRQVAKHKNPKKVQCALVGDKRRLWSLAVPTYQTCLILGVCCWQSPNVRRLATKKCSASATKKRLLSPERTTSVRPLNNHRVRSLLSPPPAWPPWSVPNRVRNYWNCGLRSF